ncbi:MAG: 50S ribosomal protein L13 [Patescibacteria group bacterium]
MRTYQPKAREIKRNWHLVDAKGKILGRMASDIVKYLMGKHKVKYAPHMDMGDYVVVINADKVEVSGRKEKQKVYYRHSGYPGGFKEIAYSKLKKERPGKIVELAVKRMLPGNRLKDKRMARLKIIVGKRNPYEDKFRKTKAI